MDPKGGRFFRLSFILCLCYEYNLTIMMNIDDVNLDVKTCLGLRATQGEKNKQP